MAHGSFFHRCAMLSPRAVGSSPRSRSVGLRGYVSASPAAAKSSAGGSSVVRLLFIAILVSALIVKMGGVLDHTVSAPVVVAHKPPSPPVAAQEPPTARTGGAAAAAAVPTVEEIYATFDFKPKPADPAPLGIDAARLAGLTLKDTAYVHIPKTGGTFIEAFGVARLANTYWGRCTYEKCAGSTEGKPMFNDPDPTAWMKQLCPSVYHRPPSVMYKHGVDNGLTVEQMSPYYAKEQWTFVRHPYDRFVSAFTYALAAHYPGSKRLFNNPHVNPNPLPMAVARDRSKESQMQFKEWCTPSHLNELGTNLLRAFMEGKIDVYSSDAHYLPQTHFTHSTLVDGRRTVPHLLDMKRFNHALFDFIAALAPSEAALIDNSVEPIKAFKGAPDSFVPLNFKCRLGVADLNATTKAYIQAYYKSDFDAYGYDM